MATSAGNKFYNTFRKAHGKVRVPTPFPALHGDTFESLPEYEYLTADERKGWVAVAKAAAKS